MHTVKAAEPESIRQPAQRAPAPNRLRLEGLVCINSKKWDKGGAQQFYHRGTVPLCSAQHRLHPAIFRRLRPLPPPSRQCSALRPRSSRQVPSLFALLYVSFAIRPHRVVDAFNSACSISPSCARLSAPFLRRIRLYPLLGYATIGSRQSSALQRFAERVLCIG